MVTRDIAIKKVEAFIQEIKQAGLNIRKAVLFGSYAKGNQREWSDIDVALVADEFTGFGFEDRKFFSGIKIKKEFLDIETRTFPTSYYEKGDPFIDEIKQTGIEIRI